MKGGGILFKRVVALTSSMLFAASSTPAASLPHLGPLKAPTGSLWNEQTIPQTPEKAMTGQTKEWVTLATWLRDKRRLNEVHYAVADRGVVPLWQNPAWRREYRYTHPARPKQQKIKAVHRVQAEKVVHRSLASRSSSVELPYVSDDTIGVHIASLALSLIGSPYRWGGDSRAGFDCSGLTLYVFKMAGMALPRTSYQQFLVGQPVSFSELKPGDLVFFSTDSPGASHVAIYVGNGLIVHALNSRTGVIVSRLSDRYYQNRFIGAKRQ